MKQKKNYLRRATSLVSVVMFASQLHAQEDFPPPPPDFGESSFPLPPPPSGSSDMGHSSPGSKSDSSGKKGNSLNKNQKQKFSQAGLEDITNENFPETIESFDFPNVEITDVIKAISELTGKNFIIDPGVRGKITIVAPSKITVAEAYKAFLSALAINGFTVVPSGSFLKVKSGRNAQRDSIETFSGTYYPNSDQMITRIIHLKHISAEQVNRDLRILPSKDGEMSVYTQTNSIILSDWGSNIDRVMKIINQLDVPGFEEQLEVVPIKFAKAKDLADLVDKIVNKGQGSNRGGAGVTGGFGGGVPRFNARSTGASSQQGASYFMAIPEERTNSIIIVGNKPGIERVKKLIARLDNRIKIEDQGGVFVYYVKHGEAKKIAQVMQGVAKDAAPKNPAGGTGAPGSSPFFAPPLGMEGQAGGASGGQVFGGEVKITADETTNSLIITAGKGDYEVVMNLLSKIDIPRDQVFVEAIIMEMSAGDGFGFKSTYYNFPPEAKGLVKQGFSGGANIESMVNPLAGAGTILGFATGEKVELQIGSEKKTVPSLIGLINLLKKTTRANILSRPQVMAMDNQEALIQVGDKVVTGANATSNQGVTTKTPIFEEALIELKLKPFINPTSQTIRMEIDQSVKQPSSGAATPKAFQDETQPIATRKIKTNIVVDSGNTAVLGGLIKDRETEEIVKVPVLGDLPIIGWLFKSKETNKEKVNMLVFITPKIIRNPSDTKQVLNKSLDKRIDFIKSQGGVDPFGAAMDEVQKRSTKAPEAAPAPTDNPDSLQE